MDYKSLNEFLMKIGELKALERTGWVIRDIKKPETVAAHQYRMAIMALTLFDEDNEDIDLNQVMKLSLIHDMGEVITGDITPYDNISQEEKHLKELDAMKTLSKYLTKKSADKLVQMFEEYEERESKESKLTKELDVFDAVLQAFEYEKQDASSKNGELRVDCSHFYREEYLAKITHPTLKGLLNELLNEREDFFSKINNNIVEFKMNGSL